MIRFHRSKFFFLLFQALAVTIICLGSLINFHQYKIWGKPLLPTFIGYKRDVEKYAKVLSFSKFSRSGHNLQKDFHGNGYTFPIETLCLQCGTGTVIFFGLSHQPLVSERVSPNGLRGPPVV